MKLTFARRPSLLRLNAAQNEPFSYVLQLNLNTTSQLFEAILPNLSFHHTYSVQVDISIFELFAVTSAQVAGLAQQIAERDNDTAGGAPSNTKAISEWDRIRAEANPYPTFEPLQPSSRFSSTSTLVSTSSELTDDDHISNQDHTRLRSWLKGHKRSASLVNRVSKRLERVKAKIGTPRSPTQQDVPSKVMKLELDMERWEDEHADAAVKQKNGPGSSWASSVSLGSEMSDVDLDEKLMP